jgi:hypothetical protein
MSHALSRRRFILSLVATLAPLSLIGFAWIRFPQFRHAVVVSLLSDVPGARVLGARYLRMAPEEADGAALAAELFSHLAEQPGTAIQFAEIGRTLAERRERDFAAGDTVIVGGWILARTEARLCALAALR